MRPPALLAVASLSLCPTPAQTMVAEPLAISAKFARSPFAVIIVQRAPTSFEVLTGHLRLAVAQEAGERCPAVVMGTGKVVWIEPDGTVTTPDAHPNSAMRKPRRRARSSG